MNKFKTSNNKQGTCFVVSSPSGAGKTTLVTHLLDRLDTIEKTISHTTRAPRPGEKDGVDYYFVDRPTFEREIQNDAFVEYADVYGHLYGTSKKTISSILDQGKDAILVIENQGAKEVVKNFANVVTILIVPPSIDELEHRLLQRQGSSSDDVKQRLSLAKQEMQAMAWYDHTIVNDDIERATQKLMDIVEKP